MTDNTSFEYEPDVLRVFQTKAETKAFYNKIAKVYDLLAEHSEQKKIEHMWVPVEIVLGVKPQ